MSGRESRSSDGSGNDKCPASLLEVRTRIMALESSSLSDLGSLIATACHKLRSCQTWWKRRTWTGKTLAGKLVNQVRKISSAVESLASTLEIVEMLLVLLKKEASKHNGFLKTSRKQVGCVILWTRLNKASCAWKTSFDRRTKYT